MEEQFSKNPTYCEAFPGMDRPPEYGSISFVEDERRAATAPPYAQLEDLSQNEETGTSNESLNLLTPLLPARETQNLDEQRVLDSHLVKVLLGGVLAVLSGIFSCCTNLFIHFVPLEFTDLSIVRSMVQLLFGLVILICTGQRPLWSETSSRMDKVYAMLFCPFYGIMVMCHHSLYPFKQLNSLQFVFSTSVISTCIWASLLLKDRFRLWKILTLAIFIIGMAVFLKPLIVWQFIDKNDITFENRGCASEISEETKLGVALIGVAILGSFLNASFEYAKTVSIGLFTVYSAFGVALVASTGAYFDPNQMILSSKFYDIPFINWTFMVGHAFVSVLSFTIFLKSVRLLGVVLSTFLFFFSSSVIQQTVVNLIEKEPVNAFGLLGGCLLSIGTIGLMAENAIRPRINGIFQQAF